MHHPPFDLAAEGIDAATSESFLAFKRAIMLHRRLLVSALAEEPMHPAQAGCLQALAHRDGMSQRDLAELLHVSRPTVTAMLQRMESTGMIERRNDAADSRITRVFLTESGADKARLIRAGFAEMLKSSIGWLPDADKRELARILGDMNEHVEGVLEKRGMSPGGHTRGRGVDCEEK